MTIENTLTKVNYNGNSSQTIFPYTFLIFEEDELEVITTVIATGVETALTLNSDYTVDSVGQALGGNVTFDTAPATGTRVTIRRSLPLTQVYDWVENDSFPAESHEQAADRTIMILQEMEETLDRTPKVPKSSTVTDMVFPDPSVTDNQGKLLRIKSDGTGLEVVEDPTDGAGISLPLARTSGGTGSAVGFNNVVFASDFANFESAITAIGANHRTLIVNSVINATVNTTVPRNVYVHFQGDGQLSVNASRTVTFYSPDNIIASLRHVFTGDGDVAYTNAGLHYPEWYGADNTGDETDDLNYCFSRGGKILLTGSYTVEGILLINVDHTEIFGVGRNSKIIRDHDLFSTISIAEGTEGVYLHDFEIQGNGTDEVAVRRGIVVGTGSGGTTHGETPYDAYCTIERIYFGGTSATAGHSVCIQTNFARWTTVRNNWFVNIRGTGANHGYGIVCNSDHTNIVDNFFISGISGQGRHAVYLTNTPSYSHVERNYCENFQGEGITANIVSGGAGYVIKDNFLIQCNLANDSVDAGIIGLYSNSTPAGSALVEGNYIDGEDTVAHGIVVYGYPNSRVVGNVILDSAYHGIYLGEGSHSTTVMQNIIEEVSLDTADTYGGIEVKVSDYVTVASNRIIATQARFGIRKNGTSPTPVGLRAYDNTITGTYSVDHFENPTTNDGWIRQSVGMLVREFTYNPGSLADGAHTTASLGAFTGASLGDLVLVSSSVSLQGCALSGYVSAADTVDITLYNASGTTRDLASHTVRVAVIKTEVL